MRRPSFLFRCKIRLGKTRIPFGEKQISGGFMLRDARFKRVFRKCEEKPKTAEHTPIFGNKTAGRGCPKQGSGRQVPVFHRTSGIIRRKYAVNFGTLGYAVLFMKRNRR